MRTQTGADYVLHAMHEQNGNGRGLRVPRIRGTLRAEKVSAERQWSSTHDQEELGDDARRAGFIGRRSLLSVRFII